MKHRELKAKLLANSETASAYDGMATEFALLQQMLKARSRAGLTQAQVAERMGTKAPAITRLETALSSDDHSPSLATLQRYAKAVGCELKIKLVKSNSIEAS